jgi:hypothetical protein
MAWATPRRLGETRRQSYCPTLPNSTQSRQFTPPTGLGPTRLDAAAESIYDSLTCRARAAVKCLEPFRKSSWKGSQ